MSDTKFTPGPWWVEDESGDIVAKDGDWEICTFTRSDNEHEADSNLIAAAPEMYEALVRITRRLRMDIDDGGRPDEWSMRALVMDAESAMTKARGED